MIDEVSAGDPTAAQERITLLDDVPLLDIEHPEVQTLADKKHRIITRPLRNRTEQSVANEVVDRGDSSG